MSRTGRIVVTIGLMALSLGIGLGWGRAQASEGAGAMVNADAVASFHISTLAAQRAETGSPWLAFLQRESMTAGLYELEASQADRQSPHERDEIYYIVEGKGTLSAGGREVAVEPGSVVFVAAGVEHRFHDLEGDLSVLVIFAGAPR